MRIVVIDDHKTNLAVFSAMLGQLENVEIKSFESSLEAITFCEDWSQTIDLVIVDYMMPHLNGIDFIKSFRKLIDRSEIPLIMITADIEKDVRYLALEAGANDFLTKPVDRVELLSRVKNMLSLRQAQVALEDRAQWLSLEIEKATETIKQREKEAILYLCKASEYRDPETGMHILRMASYSQLIAKRMGVDRFICDLLFQAAPMHDIGKVGIPDHILLKPGKLSDGEFELMKTHAKIGYDILCESRSDLFQMASTIALSHHEKWDGSGYPQGLKGEDIPLFARIVAVADVFDALTSERSYKKAWSNEEAIDFLVSNKGIHFDPQCVDKFLEDWYEVLYIKAKYQEFTKSSDL
jgi:putative two-component system response regulator